MRLHVVGNACIDTTFRLTGFPTPGETVNATAMSEGLGGKGLNQAVAAARTGAAVTLWTALGRDAAANAVRITLGQEPLELRAAAFDLPTDRSTVAVDVTGENFILSSVACAQAYDPVAADGLTERIARDDIVLLQGNLTVAATLACLTAARKTGARTMLNVSPLHEGDVAELACCDIVVVNRSEAQALAATSDPGEAAAVLAGKGAKAVIVTLGADGCLWLNATSPDTHRLPAPPASAIDTSGAGDVFCGCLAGALAEGMDMADSLRVALSAASLSVSRPGTFASCPSSREMADLLARTKAVHA